MAIAQDVGSVLGGFLQEGPEIQSRSDTRRLTEIQTDLAQRADIRAQVGQELSLAEQGFEQIDVGAPTPTSFTGRGPAALIEVDEQRFAQTRTPIGIAEARARRSQAGANKQLVGQAIVLFNERIAAGDISTVAANKVAQRFGAAVLAEDDFSRGVGQVRGIEAVAAGRETSIAASATAADIRIEEARTRTLASDFEKARVRANKRLEELSSPTNIETFSLEIQLGERQIVLENRIDRVDPDTGRQKLGLVSQLERGEKNPAVREAVINALIRQEVGDDFDELFSASQRQAEQRAR